MNCFARKINLTNFRLCYIFSLKENNFTNKEISEITELAIEVASKSHTLNDVPITFSFAKNHISALICNSSYNQDFLNGILLQIMAYHSSQDVKIVYMFSKNRSHLDLNYIKFAPHSLSDDKSIRYYAENMHDIKKISNHLDPIFQKRKKTCKKTYNII